MSFYRTMLATVAAIVIASPVVADDAAAGAATMPADTTTQTVTTEQTATTTTEQAKVNVNTATAKELMQVKGLNASKARAIVSYRKKNGNFKSLDDLKAVKGFKKMKAEHWQELEGQLSVE